MSHTDTPAAEAGIATVGFAQLMQADDLATVIEQAFGPAGLGIIRVAGVPRVELLRRRLLPLAQRFANLPEEVRVRCEDPTSLYNFGWSHGREMLGARPDTHKGSYYANPLLDAPEADADLMRRFPAYCRPNIWPDKALPELEPAFKELGRLMMDVGLRLTEHCDRFVAQRSRSAQPDTLQQILLRSPCPKGRLLHYFPSAGTEAASSNSSPSSDWCAWHTDHGSITGLTAAMYLRGDEEVPCPDSTAGLHIRARNNEVVKATIRPDELAFQVGESMQIHSGGLLQATPHFVRAASSPAAAGISRNTFAVFMQPRWDEPMTLPGGLSSHDDIGVGQWRPGMTFGEFAEATIAHNYV